MRLHEIESGNLKRVKTAIQFAVDRYRTSKTAIYKGSFNYDELKGVFYRDPTAHALPRISANTQNYTTLWVDNDPRWKKFPPRSRSLICSTSTGTAADYGTVAVVVPLKDTAIGVCPANDFWESFKSTMPPGDTTISDLNHFIDYSIRQHLEKVPNQRTLTHAQMMDLLRALPPSTRDPRFRGDLPDVVKNHGWVGMMERILDPKANGFDLTTWRKFSVKGNHEVWLSAPCAMVPLDSFKRLASGKLDLDRLLSLSPLAR
jgi:hypothetical protein